MLTPLPLLYAGVPSLLCQVLTLPLVDTSSLYSFKSRVTPILFPNLFPGFAGLITLASLTDLLCIEPVCNKDSFDAPLVPTLLLFVFFPAAFLNNICTKILFVGLAGKRLGKVEDEVEILAVINSG